MSTTVANANLVAPNFSSTQQLLKAGDAWYKESTLKHVATAPVVAVGTIATEALDTLVHAFATVVKSVTWTASTVVWAATAGNVDFASSTKFADVAQHAYTTVGNIAGIVVTPLTAVFSCQVALKVLGDLNVVPGAGKTEVKGFAAEWKAAHGLKAKVGVALNGGKELVKGSSAWTWGKVVDFKDHAFNNKKWYGPALVVAGDFTQAHFRGTDSFTTQGLNGIGAAWVEYAPTILGGKAAEVKLENVGNTTSPTTSPSPSPATTTTNS